MILDNNLRVCGATGQTLGAGAQSVVSTNSIDSSTVATLARDIGSGEQMAFIFHLLSFAGATGGATIQFQVIGASDTALTTNIVVLGQSDQILAAGLFSDAANSGLNKSLPWVVDFNSQIALSFLGASKPRYVGVRFITVLNGGTFTTGTIVQADLVVDIQDGRKFYPTAITLIGN